jgi:cbb3-type cytochrome oxidase subunit 3
MRLSDLASGLDSTTPTEIALVICLAVFGGVLLYVLPRSRRDAFDRAARLPLDDRGDHE